jgi:hypothetical protein
MIALFFGWLKRLLNFCTYLYLLRFPILTGLVAFGLPLFAWRGGAKILAGAYDQSLGLQIVALTLTDVLLMWTLLVTGHVILDYSHARGSAESMAHPRRRRTTWTILSILAVGPSISGTS